MLTRLHLPLAKMDRMKAADAKKDGPKQRTPLLDVLCNESGGKVSGCEFDKYYCQMQ